MATKYSSFSENVWEVLSRIDVTDYCDRIEASAKRPEISYLPWHKGWALLKKHFPASVYTHEPDLRHPDGTVEVEVVITIRGDTDESQFCRARLGVMNRYFQAIQNPNAREVNDSRQRALVKALAFAGLGLNLWDDTIIPVGKQMDPITEQQEEMLSGLIEKSETDLAAFLQWAGADSLEEVPATKFRSAVAMLEAKIRKLSKAKEESK